MPTNHLNLTRISQNNQIHFKGMVDLYTSPGVDYLLKLAQEIDILKVNEDCRGLLIQINNILLENNLSSNVNLVRAINKILTEGDFRKVYPNIKDYFPPDNEILSFLSSQLMELCNVYGTINKLNHMPGHNGRPVAFFKLQSLAI